MISEKLIHVIAFQYTEEEQIKNLDKKWNHKKMILSDQMKGIHCKTALCKRDFGFLPFSQWKAITCPKLHGAGKPILCLFHTIFWSGHSCVIILMMIKDYLSDNIRMESGDLKSGVGDGGGKAGRKLGVEAVIISLIFSTMSRAPSSLSSSPALSTFTTVIFTTVIHLLQHEHLHHCHLLQHKRNHQLHPHQFHGSSDQDRLTMMISSMLIWTADENDLSIIKTTWLRKKIVALGRQSFFRRPISPELLTQMDFSKSEQSICAFEVSDLLLTSNRFFASIQI